MELIALSVYRDGLGVDEINFNFNFIQILSNKFKVLAI